MNAMVRLRSIGRLYIVTYIAQQDDVLRNVPQSAQFQGSSAVFPGTRRCTPNLQRGKQLFR